MRVGRALHHRQEAADSGGVGGGVGDGGDGGGGGDSGGDDGVVVGGVGDSGDGDSGDGDGGDSGGDADGGGHVTRGVVRHQDCGKSSIARPYAYAKGGIRVSVGSGLW